MREHFFGFATHALTETHKLFVGRLPASLIPTQAEWETVWRMHPKEFHEIQIHGRLIKTPRWQQAFGMDYHYTGRTNRALPIPPILAPFLHWSREHIDQALNGLLLNWYDGALGHYIGPHRDSTKEMRPSSPIVTISLGQERIFRLRRWKPKLKAHPLDLPANNGTVFVMPWETNAAFTHEIPISRTQTGRRISITLRAFLKPQPSIQKR